MDNCLKKKTSATLKDFKEHMYYVIFFKSTVYVYCAFSTVIRTFLGEGGGRLLKILSLGRDAYLKGGTYWKLGAYSSIYGKQNQTLKTTVEPC